jgi:hypothetical protein
MSATPPSPYPAGNSPHKRGKQPKPPAEMETEPDKDERPEVGTLAEMIRGHWAAWRRITAQNYELRRCSSCKQIKDRSCFGLQSDRRDKTATWCRKCKREYVSVRRIDCPRKRRTVSLQHTNPTEHTTGRWKDG